MRLCVLPVVVCLFLAAGCGSQTVKDSWKYTTKQYRTYLNTPAKVDLEDTGECEVYEISLGRAVIEVDAQIGQFIRAMENSDRKPDQEWVMTMISRFPWLSGVALTDGEGNLVARYPEMFMKEFNVTPLLEPDPKQRISSLRAYVQDSPLGPEIYVANPVYADGTLRGLIVAYFDIRSLLAKSPEPGSFMMATPQGVLWAGGFQGAATPVGQENWAETLLHKSCGAIGKSGAEFFWTTRYLGNLPLVYAVPLEGAKFEAAPENLEALEQVDVTPPPPYQPKPGQAEGEVGNLGSPNVSPDAPAPQKPAPKPSAAPLTE